MKIYSTTSNGFTLIEVLIAVLILSIGLLGMAGIQLQGLSGSQSSSLRSQAAILANDFAERANANPAGVFTADNNAAVNSLYSNVDTANNNINCDNDAPFLCSASVANPGDIVDCTPAQMAAYDIFVWACGINGTGGVRNLLPGNFDAGGGAITPRSSATVTCNAPPGAAGCPTQSSLTVAVRWLDRVNKVNNNDVPVFKTISIDVFPTQYTPINPPPNP